MRPPPAQLDTFTERVYPFVAPVAYALSCCCLTFCGTKTPENSTTPLTVKQRYARFMNRLEAGAGGEGGSVVPGEHLLGAAGTKLQLIAPPPPAAAGASPAKKEGGKAGAAGSSAPLLRKEELLDRAGGSADAPADKQRRLPYNENDKHSVKLVKCLQSSAGCWMDLWMGDDVQIGKTMRLGEPQNGGGWRSVGLKGVPACCRCVVLAHEWRWALPAFSLSLGLRGSGAVKKYAYRQPLVVSPSSCRRARQRRLRPAQGPRVPRCIRGAREKLLLHVEAASHRSGAARRAQPRPPFCWRCSPGHR